MQVFSFEFGKLKKTAILEYLQTATSILNFHIWKKGNM